MSTGEQPLSAEEKDELFALAWAVRDNTLAPEQAERLEQLVCTNPAALAKYLELISLISDLRWNLSVHEDRIERMVPRRLRPRTTPGLRLAAMLLISLSAAALAGFALWDRRQPVVQNESSPSTSESYASLTRADNCDWDHRPASGGARKLHVRSGLAELKFASGAVVMLEGPAEFDVRSAMGGYLHRGRLAAMVPPAAIGFTVDTASAKVVDQSTQFNVQIGDAGTTDVSVFKGHVSVHPVADATSTRPPGFVVRAGEFKRISTDGTVESSPVSTEEQPITGETARASTHFPQFSEPNNAVDDSGLIIPSSPPGGAGHSCNVMPSPNKWLSQLHPVDTEKWFVITLPEVYDIHRFHIWNYNDCMGSSRGIKDVIIQYSETDPDGKEHTLGTYEFARAATHDGGELGTEYLGQDFSVDKASFPKSFRARYIRLSIRSNWSGRSDDGYGLSEIQFYGKHVQDVGADKQRLTRALPLLLSGDDLGKAL
jgi:ferric-dicitrate binding protein FerR (iron transport regulator)